MIGKISGRVDYVAEDHVLVETSSGVGYEVYCSTPTLRRIPMAGEWVALYTELVVREDLMQLYGFESRVEREWHRLLVSVQGVGAKVSLGILGGLGIAGITKALAVGDAPAVRTAPGVGPKLATRIVTELKGKAPDVLSLTSTATGEPAGETAAMVKTASAPERRKPLQTPTEDETAMVAAAEAVSALVNLGYDRGEAAAAVAEADGGDVAELIRKALQQLGQNL